MLKARQEFIAEMLPLRSIIMYQLYLVHNIKQILGLRYIEYCGSRIMSHTILQL